MGTETKPFVPITEDQVTLALETLCDHYDSLKCDGATYQLFLKHIDQKAIHRLIRNEINYWQYWLSRVPKHQRMEGLRTFFVPSAAVLYIPDVLLNVLEDVSDFICSTQVESKHKQLK